MLHFKQFTALQESMFIVRRSHALKSSAIVALSLTVQIMSMREEPQREGDYLVILLTLIIVPVQVHTTGGNIQHSGKLTRE